MYIREFVILFLCTAILDSFYYSPLQEILRKKFRSSQQKEGGGTAVHPSYGGREPAPRLPRERNNLITRCRGGITFGC